MKALIVYYSMYGHIHRMAEAVAEGVTSVPGATAEMRRVPETLPLEVLQKMGAVEAQKKFEHVPVCTVDALGKCRCYYFWYPDAFRQHVRADETVP